MSPKFLEHKLQKEYGKKSDIPYKIMNKIGAMKGNKETAKGKAMEKVHRATVRSAAHKKMGGKY